jgi:hypothetical protein
MNKRRKAMIKSNLRNDGGFIKRAAALTALMALCLAVPSASYGRTYILLPMADATVYSWDENSNFGNETSLYVQTDNDIPILLTIFLKFNLNGLPSGAIITGATLNLYCWYNSSVTDISLYYVADDSWEEYDITFLSRPEIIYPPSAQGTPSLGWKSWNLMANAKWTPETDGVLSLNLTSDGPYDETAAFYSREYTTNLNLRPYLKVTIAGHNPSSGITGLLLLE